MTGKKPFYWKKSLICWSIIIFSILFDHRPSLSITFAIISDPHIGINAKNKGNKPYELSVQFLEYAVEKVNQINDLNFVLVPGDILKDGERWNLFKAKEILSRLKVPYYVAVGNHDYQTSPAKGITKDEFIKAFKEYSFKGNKPYYSLNPVPNLRLIVLDTTSNGKTEGYISDEQLIWLEKELSENPNRPTIIMTHHPLLAHFPHNLNEWRFFMTINPEKVIGVLQKSPQVFMIISGHHHISNLTINQRIIFYLCPSIMTYPNRYVVMSITGDKLNYKTYPSGSERMIDVSKDLLLKSNFYPPDLNPKSPQFQPLLIKFFEGSDKDNEGTIDLQKLSSLRNSRSNFFKIEDENPH